MMENKDRILVVDDEPQIGKVLRRALQSRGFEVRVAPDGDSGFDVFNAWQPQLVISDLAMPNADGFQLCARIRKTSHVPIIVLSVKGEERTKVDALRPWQRGSSAQGRPGSSSSSSLTISAPVGPWWNSH